MRLLMICFYSVLQIATQKNSGYVIRRVVFLVAVHTPNKPSSHAVRKGGHRLRELSGVDVAALELKRPPLAGFEILRLGDEDCPQNIRSDIADRTWEQPIIRVHG